MRLWISSVRDHSHGSLVMPRYGDQCDMVTPLDVTTHSFNILLQRAFYEILEISRILPDVLNRIASDRFRIFTHCCRNCMELACTIHGSWLTAQPQLPQDPLL